MILVTGGTGRVGGELLRQLAHAKQPVRALLRNQDGAGRLPAGIEHALGDLDLPESMSKALKGIRSIFLLGGHHRMATLMAAIRSAQVEHVILLSFRSASRGHPDNAVVKNWQLSEHAVRSSGVAWTVLRASGFMSNSLEWAPQLRAGNVVRAPFPKVPIAAIDPVDIAAVAATSMGSRAHESQAYTLSGPAPLLPADRVAILADVLNRSLRFEALTNAQAEQQLGQTLDAQTAQAFIGFYARGEFDDSEAVSR